MTTIGEKRLDSLPKWARAKINDLQNKHEETVRGLQALTRVISREELGPWVEVHLNEVDELRFPGTTPIRFHLDDSGDRYVDVEMVPTGDDQPGSLHLNTGGATLAVAPVSRNYVAITASKR